MATRKPTGPTKVGASATSDHFDLVDLWRAELESAQPPRARTTLDVVSDGGPNNPALARLEREWALVQGGRDGPAWLSDRSRTRSTADSLLGALSVYVDLGAYPPPELMLALVEVFDRYIDASGSSSLEEILFGKPKRRAGNYAARRKTRTANLKLASQFVLIRHKSATDVEAAEKLVAELGLKIDPDDLLRKVRKYVVKYED